MLRFVGVKIFWSKSNQNLVILIWSCELASFFCLSFFFLSLFFSCCFLIYIFFFIAKINLIWPRNWLVSQSLWGKKEKQKKKKKNLSGVHKQQLFPFQNEQLSQKRRQFSLKNWFRMSSFTIKEIKKLLSQTTSYLAMIVFSKFYFLFEIKFYYGFERTAWGEFEE